MFDMHTPNDQPPNDHPYGINDVSIRSSVLEGGFFLRTG